VGQRLGLKNIKLILGGSGHFTRRMGMLVNKEHLGFGYRKLALCHGGG
jgi:peroxiredoxin